MKTFLDLQKEVARYFDLAAEITEAPDGADVEMIKSSLNQANATRVTEDRWRFMQSGQFTLTAVSGTQEYILPHSNFNKFDYLWNDSDKTFAMELPERNVPSTMIDFNQTVSNDPHNSYQIIRNGSVVPVQPPVAGTLVLTTTGLEPNSPQLYIEGEDASGNFISESVAKSGTTSQSFSKITYYAKTEDFNTALTLATTGGTTLLTLTASEYAKAYPVVRFYTIPNAAKTFKYRYVRNPRIMTRDFDIPDLPFPHSNILVYDTLLDLATFNELDSESVSVWKDKQNKLMENLYLEKLAADTLNGVGLYIQSVP